jgi:hypothetical protein
MPGSVVAPPSPGPAAAPGGETVGPAAAANDAAALPGSTAVGDETTS